MIITKLYKGKIELNFNEDRHWFSVNDEPIISVTACTSIIDKSAPLIFWAVGLTKDYLLENIANLIKDSKGDDILRLIEESSKQHRIKKEQAATAGTEVHKWAELFIKAKSEKEYPELSKDPKVYNGVTAFLKWVDEYKVKFLSSEKHIYSKKYKYAGIMDAEANIDGKTCVVDFKTSKRIYPEMRLQVAAYQAANEEEMGKKYSGDKWIVRFGKEDAEFEANQYGEQEKDFEAFLATLNLRRRIKELEKIIKK